VFDFMTLVCECDPTIGALRGRRLTKRVLLFYTRECMDMMGLQWMILVRKNW